MRGGTAESRVVPLRKKSDIREGTGQKCGFKPGGTPPTPHQNHNKEEWREGGSVLFVYKQGKAGNLLNYEVGGKHFL